MDKWEAKEGQKIPKDVHEITFYFDGRDYVSFILPKGVGKEDIRNWYLEPTGISMGKVEWTLTLEMKDGARRNVPPAEYPTMGMSIHFYTESGSGVPAAKEE